MVLCARVIVALEYPGSVVVGPHQTTVVLWRTLHARARVPRYSAPNGHVLGFTRLRALALLIAWFDVLEDSSIMYRCDKTTKRQRLVVLTDANALVRAKGISAR